MRLFARVRPAVWLFGLSMGLLVGCRHADAGSREPSPVLSASTSSAKSPGPVLGAQAPHPAFDEKKAWALLVKQCDFGPRPVGSDAHQKTRDFLLAQMKLYADKTVAQDFTYNGLSLTNVIGVFNPDAPRQVLLMGHWDTRPRADQEIDPEKKKKPILGASDGASETAVLLELARIFHAQKPAVGVVIVLVDGEDYGSFETMQGVLLGSTYFARNHKGYNPEWGVLLDMVGDKTLDIQREPSSETAAPALNNKVFRIANEIGYGKQFVDRPYDYPITDDHTPLNQAHIPTIDLIDFNYGPWHTLDDTPANCSAASLKVVGDVVAELIYREKAK